MTTMELWSEADAFTEDHPAGSRCFVDIGRWVEARIIGSAFVCEEDVLVRVSVVVGGVPVTAIRFGSETDTVCPVCDGAACFPESVDSQGWLRRCVFCSDGIMSIIQRKLYVDAAKPETDGSADSMWMWIACENPICKTRELVRVEQNRSGRVECNACFNRGPQFPSA